MSKTSDGFTMSKRHKDSILNEHLTIAQTAKIMGSSASTVRRLISNGELRAYRFSERVIRIDPADLKAIRTEVNPLTFDYVNGGGAL